MFDFTGQLYPSSYLGVGQVFPILFSTDVLSPGEEVEIEVPSPRAYAINSFISSSPCWIRVYGSSYGRYIDDRTTPGPPFPEPGTGFFAEVLTSSENLITEFSPSVEVQIENVNTLLKVRNEDTVSQSISGRIDVIISAYDVIPSSPPYNCSTVVNTQGQTDLSNAWKGCPLITHLPLFDLSLVVNLESAWEDCTSLQFVPPGFFDVCPATNLLNAFVNCALSSDSVDNILISLDNAGESGGTLDISGGTNNPPSALGLAAVVSLEGKGWSITVPSGVPQGLEIPVTQLFPATNGEESTNIEVNPNVGLSVSGPPELKTLSTLYNTLVNNSEESFPVGGAPSLPASEWKEKSLVEVLDTILFPELLPLYTIPTVTLTATQSGIKEVGQFFTQSLTVTATKNDSGNCSNITFRRGGSSINSVNNPASSAQADLPPQFGYLNSNNPNAKFIRTYNDSLTLLNGTTTWDSTGTFVAGSPLNTNKGTLDTRTPQVLSANAPQAGATVTSGSITVTGIYPYFWGKSSSLPTASTIAVVIAANSSTKVLEAASGTISATFNASSEYIWFAHPAIYTSKTTWYFTPLNQGPISSSSFISPPVLQVVDSPNSYWAGISYKIYISNYASSTTGVLELRN